MLYKVFHLLVTNKIKLSDDIRSATGEQILESCITFCYTVKPSIQINCPLVSYFNQKEPYIKYSCL